jgi:uncharacterized alkaline shock family protein YloU
MFASYGLFPAANAAVYDGVNELFRYWWLSALVALLIAVLHGFLARAYAGPRKPIVIGMQTELGQLNITREALEAIAQRAAFGVKGVKDLHLAAHLAENKVAIVTEFSVMAGLNIPDVSGQVQQAVKDEIERATGIVVQEVRVLVKASKATDHVVVG